MQLKAVKQQKQKDTLERQMEENKIRRTMQREQWEQQDVAAEVCRIQQSYPTAPSRC